MTGGAERGACWERILYQPMAYPDNYVPPDFLDTLVTPQAAPKKKRLSLLVLHALAVVQQFSAVVLFGLVFSLCRDGGSALLYTADVVLLAIALLISNVARRRLRTGRGARGGNDDECDDEDDDDSSGGGLFGFPLCLFVTLVSMASPVLRTLTDSYSSDTIYALATGLAAVHIIAHDYEDCSRAIIATMVRSSKEAAAAAAASCEKRRSRGDNISDGQQNTTPVAVGLQAGQPQPQPQLQSATQPQPLSGVLSSNAAMFGCVLLASRLPSDDQVFGLMMLAVELFALLPAARRRLCASSVAAHVAASAVLVAATALGLAAPRGLLVGAAHRALRRMAAS